MLKQSWRLALLFAGAVAAPAPLLAQAQAEKAPPAAPAAPAAAQGDADKKAQAAQAAAEEARKAKAKREQLMSKCQIKPVMSDDDIAKCRAAFAAN